MGSSQSLLVDRGGSAPLGRAVDDTDAQADELEGMADGVAVCASSEERGDPWVPVRALLPAQEATHSNVSPTSKQARMRIP